MLFISLAGIKMRYEESFERAKDERELMDTIYTLALSEAVRGNRMAALVDLPRSKMIERYLAENPEFERWANRNIEAGTCRAAAAELRQKVEEFRQWRREQRGPTAREETGELIEVTTIDAEGREITEFHGSPKTWMQQFMARPMEFAVSNWLEPMDAEAPAQTALEPQQERAPAEIPVPDCMKPIDTLALAPTASEALQKPRPSDKAVRQWLQERINSWPDDKPPPSEDQDFRAAVDHFAPGLTREEFRVVRKEVTPDAWRTQGPRKLWGQVKKSTA
jgi:hypothetical protein